ncbi:hypothetical protein E4T52_13669 [Aureobasidium sp. EXF-3400]|nr:hypothetical protein E4T51_12709 [Aureobasidium sp. EXF-12344]KAI4771327.1 hypothetical protein E4T52_13669 [Aureobasidium sp. EXF-3400]
MDTDTEEQKALRQQQLLFAAQMQNGPACPGHDDEPYEELETRYNEACGAYMFSKLNGEVSPEEEAIFKQLHAQFVKAKANQDELQRLMPKTTMDGSKRRRASHSPLFVQQDRSDHDEGLNTTKAKSDPKRQCTKTPETPSESPRPPKLEESVMYSVKRLVANAPANNKQAAIRDGRRVVHAIKQYPSGTFEYDGGDTWSMKGLKISLNHHQLINASWMKKQETNESGPKGGILADEMGLGKTISALASMVQRRKVVGPHKLKTNLVVVPPTIRDQWYDEAYEHTERPTSENTSGLGRIHIYSTETSDKVQLREFNEADLVVATYPQVGRRFKNFYYPEDLSNAAKEKYFDKNYRSNLPALFQFTFRAIYLDEGHDIRNSQTQRTMACLKLQSEYRWILTGTPMTNNPTDLYSALVFVREPTVSTLTLKEFNDRYKTPSKKDIKVEWIGNTLQRCMSRWTKQDMLFGRRLVNIPKSKSKNLREELSVPESIIYSTLRERLKMLAVERSTNRDGNKSYKYIDNMLMVLRQMTGHVLLIRPEIFEHLTDEDMSIIYDTIHDNKNAQLPGPKQVLTGQKIKQEALEPTDPNLHSHAQDYITALRKLQKSTACIMCKQITQDFRWAECYHAYCKLCLDKQMHLDAEKGFGKPQCVPCGLPMGKLIGQAEEAEDVAPRWLNESGKVIPSTKSSVVVKLLKSWKDPLTGDPRAKAVVFTWFKESHKFLAATFEEEQWEVEVLTAEMSLAQREKSVTKFLADPNKFIMLATNGVGGLGLNLMVAKYLINYDHYFNDSIEKQAYARIDRIGQTEETTMAKNINAVMKESKKLTQAELLKMFDAVEKDDETMRSDSEDDFELEDESS